MKASSGSQDIIAPIPKSKNCIHNVSSEVVILPEKHEECVDEYENMTPPQVPNKIKVSKKPTLKPYIPHHGLIDSLNDSDSRFVTDETVQKLQESSDRKSDPVLQRADYQNSPLSTSVVTNSFTNDIDADQHTKASKPILNGERRSTTYIKNHRDSQKRGSRPAKEVSINEVIAEYYNNENDNLAVEHDYLSQKKTDKKKKSFFRRIFFCKCSRKDHGDDQENSQDMPPTLAPVSSEENAEKVSTEGKDSREESKPIVELENPAQNATIVVENMVVNMNSSSESEEHDFEAEAVDEARLKRWVVKLKKLAKKQRQEKIELRKALEKSKINVSSKNIMEELDEIYAIILDSFTKDGKPATLEQLHEMPKSERIAMVSNWSRDDKKTMNSETSSELLEEMIRAYSDICPNEEWLIQTQWKEIRSLSNEDQLSGLDPQMIDTIARQEYNQLCSNGSIPGPMREAMAYELMHITKKKLLLKSHLSRIQQKSKIFELEEYKELLQDIESISTENEKYREHLSALANV